MYIISRFIPLILKTGLKSKSVALYYVTYNAKYSFDKNGATYIFHFDHLPIFSHFNFSSALWLLGEDMLESIIS